MIIVETRMKNKTGEIDELLEYKAHDVSIETLVKPEYFDIIHKIAINENKEEATVLKELLKYFDGLLTRRSFSFSEWDALPSASLHTVWGASVQLPHKKMGTCELQTKAVEMVKLLAMNQYVTPAIWVWMACVNSIRNYIPKYYEIKDGINVTLEVNNTWWQNWLRKGYSYIDISDYNIYLNWCLKQLFVPNQVNDVEEEASEWVGCYMPENLEATMRLMGRQMGLRPSLFFKLTIIKELKITKLE